MKITLKRNLLALFALVFVSQPAFAEGMPGSTGSNMPQSSHTGMAENMDTKDAGSDKGMNQNDQSQNDQNQSADTSNMGMTTTPPENTPAAQPAAATEEMAGFSRGTVARSVFTTLVDNREPVDKVQQVPQQKNDIIYFTELRDMSGQTAKHRWEFKGKIISEVKFNVRGPRWRVWSKKSFAPGWAGDWKVSVINGVGEVISEEVIAYAEPAAGMMNTDNAMDANQMNTTPEANNSMPSGVAAPDAVTAE